MTPAPPTRLSRRGRWTLAAIGLGIVAVMAGANAHLIHVATTSQPACVPHLQAPDGSGIALRAARSSC